MLVACKVILLDWRNALESLLGILLVDEVFVFFSYIYYIMANTSNYIGK